MRQLRTAPETPSGLTRRNNSLLNKSVIKYIDKSNTVYCYVCKQGKYSNEQYHETSNKQSHMHTTAKHGHIRLSNLMCKTNCKHGDRYNSSSNQNTQHRHPNQANQPTLCATYKYTPSRTGVAEGTFVSENKGSYLHSPSHNELRHTMERPHSLPLGNSVGAEPSTTAVGSTYERVRSSHNSAFPTPIYVTPKTPTISHAMAKPNTNKIMAPTTMPMTLKNSQHSAQVQ